MKARILEFEGTPDEVARVLARVPGLNGEALTGRSAGELNSEVNALPSQVVEWLDEKVKPAYRTNFDKVLRAVQDWPEVDLRIGQHRDGSGSADRIRLHRTGHEGRAAFAYISKLGRAYVALKRDEELSDLPAARSRDVNPPWDRFGVSIYIRRDDQIPQALELMHRAYENPYEGTRP